MSLKIKNKTPSLSISDILSISENIVVHSHITICRDKTDNKFLECAIDGKCIYIVSGDNDLLVLKEYEGIKIMTVKQFLDNFGDG